MKRSVDQMSSSGRRGSTDGENPEESEPSQLFVLSSQNKALSLEMVTYKRTIAEGRKELELMRRKSREMEALVSLIQRAWSQLDIDSSMLLDSLGDSEIDVPDGGSSELLFRLIHSGSQYIKMEPTNHENLPRLNVDQWSSSEEIENERGRLEAKILENRHNLDSQFGGTIDDNLAAHASFTLSLLERLCSAINENGASSVLSNADQLDRVVQTKEMHAEKLMLHDRITKLSAEIVGLNAKLKICENEKMRTAKKLDRALVAAKELEQQRSAAVVTTSADGTTTTTQPANGATEITNHSSVESTNSNSSAEKELRRQIVVLERQLTESETAKSKVEMTLTERLARPLSQTEAQVADMRRAMEELRLQCKQRVSTLIAEGEVLQDRVKNLEVSLQQVETVSAARFAELMQITEKEIATARAQTEALQTTLCSTQADLAVTNQLKTQLSEYQAMEALCTNEVRKLQNELRMMSDTQVLLRDNLSKSREREVSLETQLLQYKAANNGSKSENGDTGIDATSTETVVQVPVADHHMSELLQELEDARGNMNDLITEIETVAAEEVKARTQSGRLLRQIAEYQSMQRVALEENLRLQNQIEDVKTKFAETEHKMEQMRSIMQQQDSLLSQIRQSEQGVRSEVSTMRRSAADTSGARHTEEQKLLEARQKLVDADHSIKSAQKRNEELQKRCDELSSQCESERKARLEAQRESKNKAAKKERGGSASSSNAASGGALSTEDADMLEMTLGMLRCSVCKDRFKSVAITRCFHLFCKECIDENLRNRHRKCPACGEKFGQDDVTNIFFTH